jgi:hypothetical protein
MPEPPGGTINVAGWVVMVGEEVALPEFTVSVAGSLVMPVLAALPTTTE